MEALSRGAESAVCTDIDKNSIDIIRKNAAELGYLAKCSIVNCSCFDFAERTSSQFDVIFLDPPYNKGFIEPALESIRENSLLKNGGIVVLESDNTDFHGEKDGFVIYRQRRYGRTYITIYQSAKEE